ncbi:MAG: PepSY domain-containing protein [Pyrinomonadaceae bacterium]|nr:PepSY domain-containing protein [Pyrinomonadaceae bacterium]
MRNKNILTASLFAALATTGATAFAATHAQTAQRNENREAQEEQNEQGERGANSRKQARLARQAKITMEQARTTALERVRGKIEESELEREHGKLVYSFDIRNERGTISEVQVDAINGQVVSVEEENAQQEAAERAKDERARARTRNTRPKQQ